MFLQVLPIKLSCTICELLMQTAADCEDAELLSLLYGSMQSFAASRNDLAPYYQWVEDQVKALNEQSSVDNLENGFYQESAECSYVLALSAFMNRMARISSHLAFRLLPSAITTLTEFLLKDEKAT